MEYHRILCEILKAELQKTMWMYEIYLLLVVGISGPKKDFLSFYFLLSFCACPWTKTI